MTRVEGVQSPVIVVGAGLTGLTAAHVLARAGRPVVVLEASPRTGGQVRAITAPGGARVDVGAEAAHLGAPHVAALVRELGLDVGVVAAHPGTSLLLSRKGELVPLPAGVGPTGPTKVMPVLRSGLLSLPGLVRAGLEPLTSRRAQPEDVGVGDFIAARFGREVADTFVDPLLGNLHGGDIDDLGLHSTAAQLKPVATGRRSLLVKALKPSKQPAAPASSLPAFASWPGGLTTLVEALAEGIEVRTDTPVTGLERDGDAWRVLTADGELRAEHVVLTAAAAIEPLLGREVPALHAALDGVRMASVATVVLGFNREAALRNEVLRDHNGLMLNHRQTRTMKAMTNLTRKWPTLDAAEHHLVRLSVGRSTNRLADELDDATMVERCTRELRELIGLEAEVEFSSVTRFSHSMPQLTVGHAERLEVARTAVAAAAPGVHLAGCAVDGLGIGATVKSGQRAAAAIIEAH